ncbi:hypothetical protein OA84_00940 [Kaistella solincola]|uniref:Ferritin-like metal-binding protein YciE n=2 Tax=Kaistella solincola TaxID=510955 RepID=A0ABR4ZRK6_9FLAO|nr:hypothetical protein OA84_00940 [Kaistella solincola]
MVNSRKALLMKKNNKRVAPVIKDMPLSSRSELEIFFLNSLQEMYDAENLIEEEYSKVENNISSSDLHGILTEHFGIHLKHLSRLRKIFEFKGDLPERKKCEAIDAILCEAVNHLAHFADDLQNWEVALVLVTQKLTYYKIATYGGLAHLAIKLDYPKAATLLAVCVQEEEEFIANHLNGIFNAYLTSHIDVRKN